MQINSIGLPKSLFSEVSKTHVHPKAIVRWADFLTDEKSENRHRAPVSEHRSTFIELIFSNIAILRVIKLCVISSRFIFVDIFKNEESSQGK